MTLIQHPKLLLIASHSQFIYLIQRYGEQSGCRVMITETVDSALALIALEGPDLVLIHLKAWPHDDWKLLRRLKAEPQMQKRTVVVISAMADEARARDEVAEYWLWQPAMYDDFQAALQFLGIV